MKIALFGGRFDPPHNGHLYIAREVLRHMPDVAAVWLIPANTHPWRPIAASAQDRLAMTRLLEEERIIVSDIDIRRSGETYTIDTISELEKTTHTTYLFVCGADQIKDFDKWKESKQLEEKMQFIVFPRVGYPLPEKLPKHFTLMNPNDYIAIDDSATKIRRRVKEGLPISELVPKEVEEYIREHGLYA